MEVINKRRSVRTFKANAQISQAQIEILLRAGMQAPSALNEQPWEFIVVNDSSVLKELSQISNHSKSLADAACGIILLTNKTKVKSVLYPQDMAACTQNILLEATELKIGSCWLGTYPKEDRMNAISEYFKLPENIEPFSIIALGVLETADSLKFVDRYNPNVVHYNRW